jgi:hypothetical protein
VFPIFRVVAAPAKLTVVAFAFIKSKDADVVVRLVATLGLVSAGVLAKTRAPDPVSSEITPAS